MNMTMTISERMTVVCHR